MLHESTAENQHPILGALHTISAGVDMAFSEAKKKECNVVDWKTSHS
jgi:hypothetical protein